MYKAIRKSKRIVFFLILTFSGFFGHFWLLGFAIFGGDGLHSITMNSLPSNRPPSVQLRIWKWSELCNWEFGLLFFGVSLRFLCFVEDGVWVEERTWSVCGEESCACLHFSSEFEAFSVEDDISKNFI